MARRFTVRKRPASALKLTTHLAMSGRFLSEGEPQSDRIADLFLQAFQAIVLRFRGTSIPVELADSWIADAQAIRDALE